MLICRSIILGGLALMVWYGEAIGQIEGDLPKLGQKLSLAQADAFANLALKNIEQEFPHKTGIVWSTSDLVVPPRQLHPAFYGSFDWHSCVHGHWMLVRLLRLHPDLSEAKQIRQQMERHLTRENLVEEARHFQTKDNKPFERMYGWAWFLQLVVELDQWGDADGKRWRENLQPLEDVLVANALDYLPKLSHPIRTGEHHDTGFALALILDYARHVNSLELEALIIERARDYYADDIDYPTRYEPSGHDFFSSGWNEADLMRRVQASGDYQEWLLRFLPALAKPDGDMGNLLTPVEVSDVTDGKLVHLAGLNLSRAWCLNGIANSLPEGSPMRERLRESSNQHGAVGLSYVFSGHYEGDHWLATFAVYWLTEAGISGQR